MTSSRLTSEAEAKSFEVCLGGSDKNNHEDSAENTPRYYADHRVENRPGDGIKNMADKTACTPDVNHLRADNKVLYFTGCHVNFYQPEIGTAFLQLLKNWASSRLSIILTAVGSLCWQMGITQGHTGHSYAIFSC